MTTTEPPADEITVIRATLAGGEPGVCVFALCRQSLANRLIADSAGFADQVDNLGPGAVPPARIADVGVRLGRGEIRHMGVARGGRWVAWFMGGRPGRVPS